MGLEGFTGNESILYHLISPCRVKQLGSFTPIEREEWVPEQHAHRLMTTYDVPPEGDEISGRRTLMWNNDVEISLCRPDSTMDYFFRNGEGDEVVFVHEGSGTLETIFGDVPYKDGDYLVIPRGTTYRFVPEGPQRYLVFETPGLIEIPRRYRNQYGQILEGAPYYNRDIHPPAELKTHRDRGDFPREGPRARRLPGVRPRLPPVRRRRLGRLPLPVDVLDPRLRADHRAHPPAAALASDLRGPELRDLLVLPAQARHRPGRGADPVPPQQSPVGGDDLLRLRELRLAEGDLGRRDHAAPFGAAARPAARVSRRSRSASRRRRSSRSCATPSARSSSRRWLAISTTGSTRSRGTSRRPRSRPWPG